MESLNPIILSLFLLLQVLDEGQLTDSLGRRVDFRNTVVIMTSNIGSRQLKDFGHGVGFDTSAKKQSSQDINKSIIHKALKRAFAPEFLNRVDDVVMFNALEKEDIFKIIDIELKGLFNRVNNLGYKIKLTPAAKDFVAEKGYDIQFGARPLKRAIQKYIEDPMAEVIIQANLLEGDTIYITDPLTNSRVRQVLLLIYTALYFSELYSQFLLDRDN